MGDRPTSGRFGEFGGRFVPESLVALATSSRLHSSRPGRTRRSGRSSTTILTEYGGRPTPVTGAAGCRRSSGSDPA